jgi:hypothetical protein
MMQSENVTNDLGKWSDSCWTPVRLLPKPRINERRNFVVMRRNGTVCSWKVREGGTKKQGNGEMKYGTISKDV